jgi:hypothetical protein
MNWLATGLGVSLAAALLIQGFICVFGDSRLTRVGIQSLLLAGVSLFFCFALQSGAVVPGSEFGVIFVQGGWNTFLLGVCIVAVSYCGGLFWLSTRECAAIEQSAPESGCVPPSRRMIANVCGLGVLAGIAACFHMSVIPADAHFVGPLAVRQFGLWYPQLLLWLAVCLSQSILALLGQRGRLHGLLFLCLLIVPVALYALGWQEVGDYFTSDPYSRAGLLLVVFTAFPAAVGLSVWMALAPKPATVNDVAETAASGRFGFIGRKIRIAISAIASVLVAAILFAYGSSCASDWNCAIEDHREPLFLAWLVLSAVHAAFVIRRAVRHHRQAFESYVPDPAEIAALVRHLRAESRLPEGTPDAEVEEHAAARLRARGPVVHRERYFRALLLCCLAASLFDLIYSSVLGAGIDLLLAFACWFLLAESISQGAVFRIGRWTVHHARGAFDFCWPLFRHARSLIMFRRWSTRASSPQAGKEAVAADTPPAAPAPPAASAQAASKDSSSWGAAAAIVIRTLAVIALLVACSEALHYKSTVIETFADPDLDSKPAAKSGGDSGAPAEAKNQRLGDQLSRLLVEELGKMRADIPELVIVSGQGSGISANPRDKGPAAAGGGTNRLVPSEGNSFASAVAGSNQLDLFGLKIPLGSLALLVQVPVRYIFSVEEITGSLYKDTTGEDTEWRAVAVSSRGKVWSVRYSSNDKPRTDVACDVSAGLPNTPIRVLARDLAFRITAEQPDSGMTQSPEAFASFDRGVYHLREYDHRGRHGDLHTAIACFKEATSIDQGFADGWYQLAVAYERDHEPVRAATTLGEISNDKAIYVKSLLRRADLLANAQDFYEVPPPVVPPRSDRLSGSQEAQRIWYRVAEEEPKATALERRQAYAGICQSLLSQEARDLGNIYYEATRRKTLAANGAASRGAQLVQVAGEALGQVRPTNFYLPYYFCKRAEALYASTPDSGRADSDAREMEESVLNLLGGSVALHNQRTLQQKRPAPVAWTARPFSRFVQMFAGSPREWKNPADDAMANPGESTHPGATRSGGLADPSITDIVCDDQEIDVSWLRADRIGFLAWNSPIQRLALPYYAAAGRLAPDHTMIACNYASTAFDAIGDPEPLRSLRQNLERQIAIGDDLSQLGHQYAYDLINDSLFYRYETGSDAERNMAVSRAMELASLHYEMALQFYDKAIDINNASIRALDAYADCVWRWAVDSKSGAASTGSGNFIPMRAPDTASIYRAIGYIQKALQYFPVEADPDEFLALKTTLAELDLAAGGPFAAIGQLTELRDGLVAAHNAKAGPANASSELAQLRTGDSREYVQFKDKLQTTTDLGDADFLYLTIDIAHAYACASSQSSIPQATSQKSIYEQEASRALAAIALLEQRNEFRPVTQSYMSLDYLRARCFETPMPPPVPAGKVE